MGMLLEGIAVLLLFTAICTVSFAGAQQQTGPVNKLTIKGYTVSFGSANYNYGEATKGNDNYYYGSVKNDNVDVAATWSVGIYDENTADFNATEGLNKILLITKNIEENTILIKSCTIDGQPGAIGAYKTMDQSTDTEITNYRAYYSPDDGITSLIGSTDAKVLYDMVSMIHVASGGSNTGATSSPNVAQGNNTYVLNGHTVTFGTFSYGTPTNQNNFMVSGTYNGKFTSGKPLTFHWSVAVVPVSSISPTFSSMSLSDLMTTLMNAQVGVEPGSINVEESLVDHREGAIGVYTIDYANGAATIDYLAYYRLEDGNVCKFDTTNSFAFKDMTDTIHTE
jgi:hypothetical protein